VRLVLVQPQLLRDSPAPRALPCLLLSCSGAHLFIVNIIFFALFFAGLRLHSGHRAAGGVCGVPPSPSPRAGPCARAAGLQRRAEPAATAKPARGRRLGRRPRLVAQPRGVAFAARRAPLARGHFGHLAAKLRRRRNPGGPNRVFPFYSIWLVHPSELHVCSLSLGRTATAVAAASFSFSLHMC
jgi:hypothetical protein